MAYLSKKAFADSQGWAPSYVSKLGKQGRLVLAPDGKSVDVDATLAMIGKTADPSKEGVAQRHERARVQRDVYGANNLAAPEMPPNPDQVMAPPGGVGVGVGDFQAARAMRETYLALAAKAEFERLCGETVQRRPVEDAAFRAARLLRDTVLGLPKQIASDLASMSDPWEIDRFLTERLRLVLTDTTRLGDDELKKAMAAGAD